MAKTLTAECPEIKGSLREWLTAAGWLDEEPEEEEEEEESR